MSEVEVDNGFNKIFGNEDKWLSYNASVDELAFCTRSSEGDINYNIFMASEFAYEEAKGNFDKFNNDSFTKWCEDRGMSRSGWSDE